MTWMAIKALSWVGITYAIKVPKITQASAPSPTPAPATTPAFVAASAKPLHDGEPELAVAAN